MIKNYFTPSEIFKNCTFEEIKAVTTEQAEKLSKLVSYLNYIRYYLALPIIINSCYRDIEHNKKVGGVSDSQHLSGEAADITCKDNDRLLRVIQELKNNPFRQVIVYWEMQFGTRQIAFIHVALKRKLTESTNFINQFI